MGDDTDPLSMCSMVGIVLVVIGFLVYSDFGFATNFMVAQVCWCCCRMWVLLWDHIIIILLELL
jgi:hypothetical protein